MGRDLAEIHDEDTGNDAEKADRSSRHAVLGVTNVMMMFGGEEFQTEVIVASSGAIIGRDFLQRNKCVIDS